MNLERTAGPTCKPEAELCVLVPVTIRSHLDQSHIPCRIPLTTCQETDAPGNPAGWRKDAAGSVTVRRGMGVGDIARREGARD